MCGGLWNVQSKGAPCLLDNIKPPLVAPADAQLLITSSRHYPATPAAGLAIVAALEAELVQSGSATSGRNSTASSTSSLPIPISSSSSSSSTSSSSSEEETEDHLLFHPNDRGARKPTIFSTSLSPPSSYDISCTLYKELSYGDFLGVCFSCKRPLGPGKDIYMYRGDQAFCSIECRYNHIAADESLHCSVHINQQRVQASSPTCNQSEVTPLIAIPILV